jgi:hypothetical protein
MVDISGWTTNTLVDAETMHRVTGLLIQGNDPSKVLKSKDATYDEIYSKYVTHRGTRGMVIMDINDRQVHFPT